MRQGNSSGIDDSPLKLFVIAKKDIFEIYNNLFEYNAALNDFLKNFDKINLPEANDEKYIYSQTGDKLQKIIGILGRNHMKVVFFGRTSNGKSTVINAMLGQKVLPAGIGHTTNCFVQVEGIGNGTMSSDKTIANSSDEPYIYAENDSCNSNSNNNGFNNNSGFVKESIANVEQLANALTSDKLSQDLLVHVCWPKYKCPLLRDDVILVDSPGIDVNPDVDAWIDKYCQDADVFILVANAESTIMQTEKNFFHKVASKLSRPNVFVLNNRWDASTQFDKAYTDKVVKQHTERITHFLLNELGVLSNPQESKDRIFFISAKEVLEKRLLDSSLASSGLLADAKTKYKTANNGANIDGCHGDSISYHRTNMLQGTGTNSPTFGENFEERYNEFKRFEQRFQECISKSALRTKFEQHSQQALNICQTLLDALEKQIEILSTERERLVERSAVTQTKLNALRNGLKVRETEFDTRATRLGTRVKECVTAALEQEIRRLGSLVDEFNTNDERRFVNHQNPFKSGTMNVKHTYESALFNYKKGLVSFVEDGLSRNISSRCLTDTLEFLYAYKQDLMESFAQILPIKGSKSPKQYDFKVGNDIDITDHARPDKSNLKLPLLNDSSKKGDGDNDNNTYKITQDIAMSPDTAAMLKTAFHMDCRDLWTDFEPRLEFRFSLSPRRLINRLVLPMLGTTSNSSSQNRSHDTSKYYGKSYKNHTKFEEQLQKPQSIYESKELNKKMALTPNENANISIINSVSRHSLPDNNLLPTNSSLIKEKTEPYHKNAAYESDNEEDESGDENIDNIHSNAMNELRHLSLIATGSLFGLSSAGTGVLGMFILWRIANFILFAPLSRSSSSSSSSSSNSLLLKIASVFGALYGATYLYERACWTARARERTYKRQFVRHGATRLRVIAERAATHTASHVTADAQRSLTHLVTWARSYARRLEMLTQTDVRQREVCDRLLANSVPALETRGFSLRNAIQNFISTYFKS